MSDNTMPERIIAGVLDNEGTEYIRADVAAAQLAERDAEIKVLHKAHLDVVTMAAKLEAELNDATGFFRTPHGEWLYGDKSTLLVERIKEMAFEMDARIAELEAELLAAQECVSETSGKLAFMREDRNLYHGIARQQTETIDALIARIAELEAAQRWVSVEERLPEPLTDVIVTDGEMATVGWASKHGAWNVNGWSSDGVSHWMPLPPPPVTDVTPDA